MAHSDQIVDQVQSLNDIVEVVSAYVPLKRAGRNFKANCPFHQEKTPSFIVNPDKQIFHCFGCGVGGDVFSFLMKYEQMTFPEALKRLAERVHVTLPETRTSPKERSQIERLHQIYVAAADFYHLNLKHPELGKIGRDYLANRQFGEREIDTFHLGFSLPEWRTLYEHLSKKGFEEQELLRSGLIVRSSQGKTYDLFRNRVMFPIFNHHGKVVALGGRVLGNETPKYLNSPETPIFRKRREMYGLYIAKKVIATSEEVRRILIVEGYLDCIRLHTNGFQNAVATLGTSLTPEHVQVLKRYADEAIVLFDGDKAGEQASLRSLDIFLEEGMSVKVLCFPKGFDPDDFIRSKGAQAFGALLKQPQDIFDFKLQALLARYNKSDSLGLLKITSEFLDTFAKIKSPVLADRYLKRLAVTLGVEEGSLRSELVKLKAKQQSFKSGQVERHEIVVNVRKSEPQLEKLFLSLMLHYPPYIRTFLEVFPEFSFTGEKTRELFNLFAQLVRECDENQLSTSKILNRIKDENLKVFASELVMMEWGAQKEDRERFFQELVHALKTQQFAGHLKMLRNQITQAEEAGDQESVLRYMKAYQDLLAQKETT
ncbi:MAG: DNA primase [Candidatus Omnitrophica bacterium]|nr:DNA primase [Candidatus Omnitrophota bacterium]